MASERSGKVDLSASKQQKKSTNGLFIDSAIVATVFVSASLAVFQIYSTLL